MRINKFIAESGACSRRAADQYVASSRVTINGMTAVMGSSAEAGDTVCIDGKRIAQKKAPVYILLSKPSGITCTTDRHEPDNIINYLRYPERIFPVGRLDKDSEGLILLTNDGDIVNKILRAENHHEKEYLVEVDKPITETFLKKMANGVPILDTVTKPCKIQRISDTSFRITLTQGLNRQIRRMCEFLGYAVIRLERVRIMNITIGKMIPGDWRYLTTKELAQLMDLLEG